MQTIKCPNCGNPVEISSVLEHEVREKVIKDVEKKHLEELKVQEEIVRKKVEKKLKDEISLDLKLKDEESQETRQKNDKLREEMVEMTKLISNLKEENKDKDLEMRKKLMEEEERIRKDAQKKAEEEHGLKDLEKTKMIEDLKKSLEEMRRKAEQGSQQAQGEVFELEFERLLGNQYPNDKVLPVGKGIRGGDIVQEVWDSRGTFVGKILWEFKNTKNWSEGWVNKLKSDKRSINAEEAVLVSITLPSDMNEVAGFRNSIWVTQQSFIIPLADTLRAKLIQLHYVRNSVKGKDEKMEILYKYLSGTEFVHRVEAIVDAFTNLQMETEKEKRYFANKWARDEKNIRTVIDSTYGMHGDLKGLIGDALPKIRGLGQEELEDGKK